ncbi:MAG: electron transport complex subunit RsxD [Gammaproteobacteria bacterium]|nr:electron transport complex subunit RsxD [Gammaproteobacteria bacterium]
MHFNNATSSPHMMRDDGISQLMLQVLIALIPGTLAMFYFFGWGLVFNLIIAISVAIATEAAVLKLRKRALKSTLLDLSALVTACLLALALPPLAPWWLTVIATLFAILLGKHLYGGLGFNPFNPAMVGYVVVMISFPREMTFWLLPSTINPAALNIGETFNLMFLSQLPATMSWDSISSATLLDGIKNHLSQDHLLSSLASNQQLSALVGKLSGTGWEWINLFFMAGGLWLFKKRIIDWRIPFGLLTSLSLVSLVFYLINNEQYLSPLTHLFSGGIMLAAFFIATDPVSASTTPRGRIIFGAGIGVFIFIIRQWGGYPDGIAFAVLLMNMAAPLIDYYTVPAAFGKRDEP